MPMLIGTNRTLLSRPTTTSSGPTIPDNERAITNEADVMITDENDQPITTPNED